MVVVEVVDVDDVDVLGTVDVVVETPVVVEEPPADVGKGEVEKDCEFAPVLMDPDVDPATVVNIVSGIEEDVEIIWLGVVVVGRGVVLLPTVVAGAFDDVVVPNAVVTAGDDVVLGAAFPGPDTVVVLTVLVEFVEFEDPQLLM